MSIKAIDHSGFQETVSVIPAGEAPKKMGSSFFRGSASNFNPYGSDHVKDDFASRFLLKGWTPDKPFISPATNVTAFGSCFAENISKHLAKLGFDVSKNRDREIYISSMGEGLVNVHSIVQQFRWALEGIAPPTNLWHGYKAEEFDLTEEIRTRTRDVFLKTDVFILTFGLSEIWYDELTGGVFWRAVPMKHYDPGRHKFRVCTFGETKACIQEIIDLIGKHVPRAKIVVTVSPIPLVATFRPIACLTANSASKAIIRAAVDETIRESGDEWAGRLYYFPAYEIVNEAFPNRFVEDGRHLQNMIVPAVMNLFQATYCNTDLTIDEAEKMLKAARLQSANTLDGHALFSQARFGSRFRAIVRRLVGRKKAASNKKSR
ncbi:GSCFA domain-containing protein [Sinorhizobium garamanticum]|uniref:GSCFA domain-containing protein n=1 Tax=Sinorhizobium garamanticum TaxID=680247 RepID=A0ABY8D850_9HYPH|nr:GSCFA domain-containing protein [Sinorhizobium garamanticum]WEX86482.1 GSCFA domain-containing protein [Sinorhizobium garamanticum]